MPTSLLARLLAVALTAALLGVAPAPAAASTASGDAPRTCVRPKATQRIAFSAERYPTIRRHVLDAIDAGWPRTLVINRTGADARRDQLLEGVPTRPGFDRDEYPPAVGRGRGRGLVRGVSPRGWMASIMYVPSSENRSHGSSLGSQLRRFCNGTRFRYAFEERRSTSVSSAASPGAGTSPISPGPARSR